MTNALAYFCQSIVVKKKCFMIKDWLIDIHCFPFFKNIFLLNLFSFSEFEITTFKEKFKMIF